MPMSAATRHAPSFARFHTEMKCPYPVGRFRSGAARYSHGPLVTPRSAAPEISAKSGAHASVPAGFGLPRHTCFPFTGPGPNTTASSERLARNASFIPRATERLENARSAATSVSRLDAPTGAAHAAFPARAASSATPANAAGAVRRGPPIGRPGIRSVLHVLGECPWLPRDIPSRRLGEGEERARGLLAGRKPLRYCVAHGREAQEVGRDRVQVRVAVGREI